MAAGSCWWVRGGGCRGDSPVPTLPACAPACAGPGRAACPRVRCWHRPCGRKDELGTRLRLPGSVAPRDGVDNVCWFCSSAPLARARVLRAFVISCCFANCRVLCGSRGRAVAPLLSPRPAVPAGCVRTERLGPGAGDRLKFGRFRAVSAGLPARGLWGFSAPALDPLTRSSCTWRPLAMPPRHRWLSLPAQPEVPWNRGDSFQDTAEQLWPRELRPQQHAGPGDTCISPCCSFPR